MASEQTIRVELTRAEARSLSDVGAAWLQPDESGAAATSPHVDTGVAKLRAALDCQPKQGGDAGDWPVAIDVWREGLDGRLVLLPGLAARSNGETRRYVPDDPSPWEKLMNAEIQRPGKVYVEHDNEDQTGEWMDGEQVNALVRSLRSPAPQRSVPIEGGCQRPDACKWNWWPDHCQCPTDDGKRIDAPEPPEMVERNRVSAANETNARIKRDQERVERCAEYLRKAEARAEKTEARLQEVEAERDQADQALGQYAGLAGRVESAETDARLEAERATRAEAVLGELAKEFEKWADEARRLSGELGPSGRAIADACAAEREKAATKVRQRAASLSSEPQDRIGRLEALDQDWDSHDGNPPAAAAIERVRGFDRALAYVPTAEGGVQIEYHALGLHFEAVIQPDGEVGETFLSTEPKPAQPQGTYLSDEDRERLAQIARWIASETAVGASHPEAAFLRNLVSHQPRKHRDMLCTCGRSGECRACKEFAALREGGAANGVGLIAVERERQVSEEGWAPEHDDGHDDGELARAAAAYALVAGAGPTKQAGEAERLWPFTDGWKPSGNDVRDLIKAGALIAAEIDRLQRARSHQPQDNQETTK